MSRDFWGIGKYTILDKKYYRPVITLYGQIREIKIGRKQFRTATEADDYAKRWRERVIRFRNFANRTKLEVKP
jgi:hypothetical protein